MNEKIKYLVEKSNATYLLEKDGSLPPEIKKFTELVIQECCQKIKDSDATCKDEWDYAERDLIGQIKEYFGMEDKPKKSPKKNKP